MSQWKDLCQLRGEATHCRFYLTGHEVEEEQGNITFHDGDVLFCTPLFSNPFSIVDFLQPDFVSRRQVKVDMPFGLDRDHDLRRLLDDSSRWSEGRWKGSNSMAKNQMVFSKSKGQAREDFLRWMDKWSPPTWIEDESYEQVSDRNDTDLRLQDLHGILCELQQPWPSDASYDYRAIPQLHPVAAMVCDQGEKLIDSDHLHVYTDGSAFQSSGRAAWAFHVVAERQCQDEVQFVRVCYTGDVVQQGLYEAQSDSLDAEAMALIQAADWLLSCPPVAGRRITIHFDALAARLGAFGDQAIPGASSGERCIQNTARAAMMLAQCKHEGLEWRHIHAHSGQPDNEAVDSIAKALAQGWEATFKPPYRLQKWNTHSLRDWAWIEIAPTAEMPGIQTILQEQGKQRQFRHDYLDVKATTLEANSETIGWKIGSANVRSLEKGDQIWSHKSGLIEKQVCDQGYDMFFLQECRSRHAGSYEDGNLVRIWSPGAKGTGGVEAWFRKEAAFKQTGFGDISKEDFVVWYADERFLGLTCMHMAFNFDVVVIYAPQSGKNDEEIKQWWNQCRERLKARPSQRPFFLVGDANAHVGSVITESIRLVVPSTFENFHVGQSETFQGYRGGRTRVDYIAVPDVCFDGVKISYVDTHIDLMNGELDHYAIGLELEMQLQERFQKQQGRIAAYDRNKARSQDGLLQLGKLAANIPEVPWEMEVNDHWKLLRETVSTQCAAWFPKEKRQQRQRYMSETAWGLVCQRKDLRIEIHRAQRDPQQRLLQYIFGMWRSGGRQSSLGDVDEHLVDQQIALNIWKRNQLQKSFKRLKLQERKEWAMKCAETFQGNLCQARVVDWYKMMKPKRAIKGKTIGTSQMPGIKAPDGQWVTSKRQVSVMWQAHFGAIEHARNAQGKDILAMSQPDGIEKTFDTLLATPTIFEIEKAMRQMDVKKAPGPDQLGAEVWKTNVPQMAKKVFPIFLKTSMRCQWVAEMAGGDLIPLHKKRRSDSGSQP